MNICYVVYSIPLSVEEDENCRIEKDLDLLLGRKSKAIEGTPGISLKSGGEHLDTSLTAAELLEKFKSISKEIRVLLLPRNPAEDWVCYPPSIRPSLVAHVDRDNVAGTRRDVEEWFAGLTY